MTYTVHHDPERFACNMGYVVRNAAGAELSRGPEWAMKLEAHKRNAGTYRDRLAERADATAKILTR